VHKADRTGEVYGNDPDGGDEVRVNKHNMKTVGHEPDLDDDQIVKAYDMINHTDRKKEPVVLIDAQDNVSGDGKNCTKVKNEQELMQKLLEAKKNHQLPVILGVDCEVEPFWTDSGHGDAGGSSGGHVVTVTDIQPGPPPKVSIANQWGKDKNHLGEEALPLRDVFIAMHTADKAEPLLRHDVEEDRKNGKCDSWKELELVRLEHFNKMGELTKKGSHHTAAEQLKEYHEYTDKLAKTINQATDKWAEQEKAGTLDPDEKKRTVKKIGDLIDDPNLPPSGQLKLLKLSRDKGLINEEAYDKEIGQVMLEMTQLKDAKPGTKKEENAGYEYKQQEYKDSLPALKETLLSLPEEERKTILDKFLNDDEKSDRAKFAFLRSVHDLGVVGDDEFVQRAAKAFHEFKDHEDAGKFKSKRELRQKEAAKDEGAKLLDELPTELADKIRSA
jgi:hypothetical protein